MTTEKGGTILLFDVDGTLTKARQVCRYYNRTIRVVYEKRVSSVFKETERKLIQNVTDEMWEFLRAARDRKAHDSGGRSVALGVVSGSDYAKVLQQLGNDVEALHSTFDYVFTENGLVGYRGSEKLPSASLVDWLGEKKLQNVINFCLSYLANIRIPVKRGNFIEFRKGMLNVSPIGRSCSQKERDEFVAYERDHPVRVPFVEELRRQFCGYGLTFSIGGQISVDIFPNGWDKTYCLRYLTPVFENIHFFGDRTAPGGNDHEIYEHKTTIGHAVENPEHTQEVVNGMLR